MTSNVPREQQQRILSREKEEKAKKQNEMPLKKVGDVKVIDWSRVLQGSFLVGWTMRSPEHRHFWLGHWAFYSRKNGGQLS